MATTTSAGVTMTRATERAPRLARRVLTPRVGAIAGIAYAVLVAVENIDVLDAPSYGSSVADVAHAYEGHGAKLAITTVAGGLALVAYLVAALVVWSSVRGRDGHERDGHERPWSVIAVGAAVAGPVLGACALAVHATLALRIDGLSADSIDRLHHVRLAVHASGAIPIGLFAVVASVAGAGTARLPRWLARCGMVVGGAALVGSTATITRTDTARAALLASLAAAMVWLLATSIWLVHRDWAPGRLDPPWVTTARVLAGAVAVAAGVSGMALLAFPAATADFFSWRLGPPPLASLVGGCYVASALVYARAATAPWAELRTMVIGIVALTVPIFAATMAHVEVFDLGRLQAIAWVVLFGGFLAAAVGVLTGAPPTEAPSGRRVLPGWRVATGALAAGLVAVSIALWVDPAGGAGVLPFTPTPLSGRVLGGWTFLVAVLAAHLSIDAHAGTGRLAALAIAAFPAGALAASVRNFGDLAPAGSRAAYVVGLVVWLAVGTALARTVHRADGPSSIEHADEQRLVP
jgi:hypothetical protein